MGGRQKSPTHTFAGLRLVCLCPDTQPRKHRSLVALVALFGGSGGEHQTGASISLGERDADTPTGSQSLLGATWLPISHSVVERGHLADG